MLQNPLFQRLETAKRVLVAGAGGGFDIMSGLPIAFALRAMGKTVHLANLTFTDLGATEATALGDGVHEVRANTRPTLYRGAIERTESAFEVSAAIEAFRHGITTRARRLIPA
ncbi:hypothetical protein AKJ09_09795 [Labilithrix luteola]|uniref:DUF1152 domain-containing protein n=1 Tax=Labilithrix luteola TaxID=1391654 RepID=A0A0K1QBT1_9BACT|nr:hypothetical protein [Labilithrix luteola]AKV03132.1 hypothetical protein AKJ09_09795 [Labilithrix luteola]